MNEGECLSDVERIWSFTLKKSQLNVRIWKRSLFSQSFTRYLTLIEQSQSFLFFSQTSSLEYDLEAKLWGSSSGDHEYMNKCVTHPPRHKTFYQLTSRGCCEYLKDLIFPVGSAPCLSRGSLQVFSLNLFLCWCFLLSELFCFLPCAVILAPLYSGILGTLGPPG